MSWLINVITLLLLVPSVATGYTVEPVDGETGVSYLERVGDTDNTIIVHVVTSQYNEDDSVAYVPVQGATVTATDVVITPNTLQCVTDVNGSCSLTIGPVGGLPWLQVTEITHPTLGYTFNERQNSIVLIENP